MSEVGREESSGKARAESLVAWYSAAPGTSLTKLSSPSTVDVWPDIDVGSSICSLGSPSFTTRLVRAYRFVIFHRAFVYLFIIHLGPGGQIYYHNAQTQESTYVRPLPAFPIQTVQPVKKKKEKPLVKTPIPGTDWIRVRTTEGNIFYSHKVKKESLWTVPEEIKEAVTFLEKEEKEKEEKALLEASRKEDDGEAERLLEIERVKAEVKEMVKRKAEDPVPVDEVVISKKARVEEEEDDDDDSDDSEEEEWQREAAAQLAAEAEEEKKRVEEEARKQKEDAEEEARKAKEAPPLNMPARVDLSVEEGKALFKVIHLARSNIDD